MGPMVWKVLGTGSAVLAATVAQKLVTKGWELASGKSAGHLPAALVKADGATG